MQTIPKLCDQLIEQVSKRYGDCIGEGRHRIAYRSKSGKYVIKVPRNQYGVNAQYHEMLAVKRDVDIAPKARLVHDKNGVPIIVMEMVDCDVDRNDLPPWCDWIDCQQVGYTRKGKLVAYDLGG